MGKAVNAWQTSQEKRREELPDRGQFRMVAAVYPDDRVQMTGDFRQRFFRVNVMNGNDMPGEFGRGLSFEHACRRQVFRHDQSERFISRIAYWFSSIGWE